MARKPVSVFKRPTKIKGRFRYYIKLWDAARGEYTSHRSAQSIITALGLDESKFSPNSRTGALLIGQELLRRGGFLPSMHDPLFADYCASIWDWETSAYIKGKLARGQRIGKEHATHCAAYIRNYVRPAFPALKLSAVKLSMLESFLVTLKSKETLGNRSINAIIDAMRTPLSEAARLGLIPSNPADGLARMGNDTREKGIPTEYEMRGLLSLPGLDPRIRVAVLLGSACALRIGEIQAIRREDIGMASLTVAKSWGKLDGLKDTKTGRVRIVPLPSRVRAAMLDLFDKNPHGPDGFLIYGVSPDSPLDVRAIERGFDNALVRLSLGLGFTTATKEEKTVALMEWKTRNITFHSSRHWSNAMLRGSMSDEKLHLLTGHSTKAMSKRYDHCTEADLAMLSQAQEQKILSVFGTI